MRSRFAFGLLGSSISNTRLAAAKARTLADGWATSVARTVARQAPQHRRPSPGSSSSCLDPELHKHPSEVPEVSSLTGAAISSQRHLAQRLSSQRPLVRSRYSTPISVDLTSQRDSKSNNRQALGCGGWAFKHSRLSLTQNGDHEVLREDVDGGYLNTRR